MWIYHLLKSGTICSVAKQIIITNSIHSICPGVAPCTFHSDGKHNLLSNMHNTNLGNFHFSWISKQKWNILMFIFGYLWAIPTKGFPTLYYTTHVPVNLMSQHIRLAFIDWYVRQEYCNIYGNVYSLSPPLIAWNSNGIIRWKWLKYGINSNKQICRQYFWLFSNIQIVSTYC